MTKLSVNLNKVATLRNARGGSVPSVVEAAEVVVAAGGPGITVHPREDERHIRPGDVRDLAAFLEPLRAGVEYNIEGDVRPELMDLVVEVKPHQCTLVPVRPGEVTSEAGWPADTPRQELGAIIERLRENGVRVSVFVEAERAAIDWAKGVGADRVELYTEPYAAAFGDQAGREEQLLRYAEASRHADELGLGVNAGHDLDLENLPAFVERMPRLDEVSIGHALISQALFEGLDAVVRKYLDCL